MAHQLVRNFKNNGCPACRFGYGGWHALCACGKAVKSHYRFMLALYQIVHDLNWHPIALLKEFFRDVFND